MNRGADPGRSQRVRSTSRASMMRWITALLALCWAAPGYGQSARGAEAAERVLANFDDVRACQPLPDGRVVSATGGGVVVFSKRGRVDAVLTRLDGLPGTRAHALALESDAAHLWIGTEAGVARWDVASTKLDAADDLGGAVRDFEWHAGRLHAAVWERGVAVRNTDGSWSVPAADSSARITDLQAHAGKLHAAHAGGGIRVLENGIWTRGPGDPTAHVWSLASYAGQLWWSGFDGVRNAVGPYAQLAASDVRALAIVAQGVGAQESEVRGLLVGSYDASPIRVITAERNTPLANTKLSGVVSVRQAHGSTCVATNRGLYVRRDAGFQRWSTPSVGANDVAALAEFGGKLWLGSFDRGLHVVEGDASKPVASTQIDRRVNALLSTPTRLWVGTARGLLSLDRSGKVVANIDAAAGLENTDVHAIAALSGGRVAVGTGHGFAIVSGSQVTNYGKKSELPLKSVWALAPAERDGLWLGTTRGLYLWRQGEALRRFSVSSGHLRDDWVTSLLVQGDRLFVGTYAHGVTELRLTQNSPVLVSHLDGGYVNFGGLSHQDGALYAATMSGLLRRDSSAESGWVKLERAAPGVDVTARLSRASGEVVVASRRGLGVTSAVETRLSSNR